MFFYSENKEMPSGNIRLRLPKSLHLALLKKAELEGVSMNQLCMYYLSLGTSRKNLGSEEFNHRLEIIANDCKYDTEKLFQELSKLNNEVEQIKESLIQEIKNNWDEKKSMWYFVEILTHLYPVFHNNLQENKLPYLKIPSAKVVVKPKKGISPSYEKILGIVNESCECANVAYGSYDMFLPLDVRGLDKTARESLEICVCCNYNLLKEYIDKIVKNIENVIDHEMFEVIVKPSYLITDTALLL